MTAPVASLTPLSSLAVALPSLDLSDDERTLIARMRTQLQFERTPLALREAYYNGRQVVQDLHISIPPQLRGLHVVIGWPRIGVDAIEQRLDIESWRYSDASDDSDDDLLSIWTANDGATESGLAHLDAFVHGRSYATVGANDDGGPSLIAVESPKDMTVLWDSRRRIITAALREWEVNGRPAVTLYLPDETIHAEDSQHGMRVVERDEHRLGQVPVVRLVNRQRVADRGGHSEITPEVMSITDAACRTLLGMEVAREFYGAPQRYILGASESAFQDASGNPVSAWQTYIGRVLALERDEEGNVPAVGQFAAYDPSTYTRILDLYARIMATQLGLPPHYLGYTTDNPASADAIRSTEAQLVKRAERKQRAFTAGWSQVMRLALLVRDGSLPPNADKIEPVWRNPATPTIAASTDAAVKLVTAGVIPASSDVTLEMVGLTAGQQRRVQADRKTDEGAVLLRQLAASQQVKAARGDAAFARAVDITPPKTEPQSLPAPPPGQ